jgi:hypothetical protein
MRDTSEELRSLLEELKEHFTHELTLMEGNFGLTGEEDEAEMEISGEIREWREVRSNRDLLARIERQIEDRSAI